MAEPNLMSFLEHALQEAVAKYVEQAMETEGFLIQLWRIVKDEVEAAVENEVGRALDNTLEDAINAAVKEALSTMLRDAAANL